MVNILLSICVEYTVRECWVGRFIKCYDEIKSKFSCKYDHQWALYEDPELIQQWFQLVHNTIKKYGILLEDIYNFDKIGFQMGVIATARVVTGSERSSRASLIQPGNQG